MNFNYPEALPVSRMGKEIQDALRTNQTIIVAGDTGSGKTTQLPKLCLELLGVDGIRVGCTQPRRIAAMTVAARVAEELGRNDSFVGHTIRFQDRTTDATRIKFMTDGILLAETRRDRLLREYDAIIIDEAHERSLNIDFLLGHLKNILPKRKDLKLVVTSATIDTEAFSKHFDNAPIVSVPGKTYPVEVRYRPPQEDTYGEPESYIDCAVNGVVELMNNEPPGDILVFMPTERDIRSCCELLSKQISDATVLPLFGRLHGSDQKRIFQPTRKTKIVVATNVAETSITVPGIRYVVDTGLARMAYYNHRSKTHSLPIQKISRASCDQRKGRCGRVGPGICIRLYQEDDYLCRDEYTTPEIKRSNLAEVILQMLSFRLGDPHSFPFIDPPQPVAITEGYNQLLEFGAISTDKRLTHIGRRMAAMPIDPAISRIIIEAERNNCLREIMIIATVLAIQDPRVRPADREQEADRAHAQFADERSDFLSFLKIWDLFHSVKKKTSWSRLKKFCIGNYLSFQRMREWIDLHQQMSDIVAAQTEVRINAQESSYEAIHKSLCAGFLRNIAMKKEGNLYTAASGREVMIFPGSHLFKSGPRWLMASAFLETNRMYALNVAAIEPDWLEEIGKKLCRYRWSNPRYHKKSGQVVADEHVTLFGLPIVASRRVNYGRTSEANRVEARSIFIQAALVEDTLSGNYAFLEHNRRLLSTFEDLEQRLRVRDILVSEEAIFNFYDEKLPPSVYDRFTLNRFLKKKKSQNFLKLSEEDITERQPQGQELADFPPTLTLGSHTFKLEYVFDPASDADGVTVHIPVSFIDIVKKDMFEWLVPGLIKEKTTFLLKSLPKRIRKHLIPLNTTVDNVLDDMVMYRGSYYRALEASIFKHFRITINSSDWNEDLPRHLMMRFSVFDLEGEAVLTTRSFTRLQQMDSERSSRVSEGHIAERQHPLLDQWQDRTVTSWDFEGLPERIPLQAANGEIAGYLYPALVPLPEKMAVVIDFVDRLEDARKETREGMRLLYRIHFSAQYKALKKHCKTQLSGPSSLWLIDLFQEKNRAVDSILDFILDAMFETAEGQIPEREKFEEKIDSINRQGFFQVGKSLFDSIMSLLRKRSETVGEIRRHERLSTQVNAFDGQVFNEYRSIVEEIMPPDFLERITPNSFDNLERYLQSLIIRIERAHADMEKDKKKARRLAPHEQNLALLYKRWDDLSEECRALVDTYQSLLQEMRVSLFSPELKTAIPVSEKKLNRAWQEIGRQC